MRKISAHYVIPVNQSPLKHGIISLNDEGLIADIIENPDQKEFSQVEFFNGVIVPGFVNTHCHLELSHLRGTTTKNAGIATFISEVVRNRTESKEKIHEAIKKADSEMIKNGIVAVGDIVNTDYSADVKKKSKIHYHNFIELFGLDELKNEDKIDAAKNLLKQFENSSSITPHSFYSVNSKLLNSILNLAVKNNKLVTIHNQESLDEQQLFENQSGNLYNFLMQGKNGTAIWDINRDGIVQEVPSFSKLESSVLLVHNTYTCAVDIEFFKKNIKNLFWVLCPKSNLYIENKLPDINLFIDQRQALTIGTDSLGSNDTLNILEEIKVIRNNFKNIPFHEILKWATMNGAKAFSLDKKLGTIEKGKQPGLNLINKFDFVNFTPTMESSVSRIV